MKPDSNPNDEMREKERLEPGSRPDVWPPPAASRKPNGAALPGSQNEDLKGPKPGRGPRGAGT